jgi:Family of unknown function (DUF5681)
MRKSRKPPISTRFQPGQSGNPKGRPKGAKSPAAMAHSALERKIRVTDGGSARNMSVREVAMRRLAEKAISGDSKCLDFLLSLEASLDRPRADQPTDSLDPDQDREIIQNYFNRQLAPKEDKR